MTQLNLARRAFLGMGMVAMLGNGAYAYAVPGDASGPIRSLNSALLSVMRAGKTQDFAHRFDMLAPVVDQAFDLDAILQGVVGPRWAALAEADKATLRGEFRRFTIASWVANFDSFNGEDFVVKPDPRAIGDGALVVDTQFAAPGSTPITLSYVMRPAGTSWRAVDILAEGTISRVAVLRSDFRQVLAQGGAPALAARLREKSDALAAGKAE
jgi:phospholipid transport system substrate-binding protein